MNLVNSSLVYGLQSINARLEFVMYSSMCAECNGSMTTTEFTGSLTKKNVSIYHINLVCPGQLAKQKEGNLSIIFLSHKITGT